MLSDLPLELVDSIAAFLSYSDLVSLKLTCKRLASQVEFVEARVRRLNVFIDALPSNHLTQMNNSIIAANTLLSHPRCLMPRWLLTPENLHRTASASTV